jgi:hypothetical protein
VPGGVSRWHHARADEVGKERRRHADAASQVGDPHPGLQASFEKHTAATRLIEAVQHPKPVRGRRAGCESVLASDVIPGILIHTCRSGAAAAAYLMPATSRVAARYQAAPGSPALAVGLTSADLGLHREVRRLGRRLGNGRRWRDILEVDARRVQRPVPEQLLDGLQGRAPRSAV